MAVVVKLVNTPDCGSGIPWVRVPSIAPFDYKIAEYISYFFTYINNYS